MVRSFTPLGAYGSGPQDRLLLKKAFKASGVAPLPDPAVDKNHGAAAQRRGWPASASGSAWGARRRTPGRCQHERGIKDAHAPRCPEPGRVAFPAVLLSARHGAVKLPAVCRDGFAGCGIRPLSPIMASARMPPGWTPRYASLDGDGGGQRW